MKYFVTVQGHERTIEARDGVLHIEGDQVTAELSSLPGTDRRHLRLADRSVGLFARMTESGWLIELEGRAFSVRVEDERARHIREMAGSAPPSDGRIEARAPMPGLIVKVEVEVGQEVEEGAGLVVMEAMKMENELRAEAAGTVTEVQVEPGRTVDRNDLLVVIER
jgi:pyruvate carboxylase subunit B